MNQQKIFSCNFFKNNPLNERITTYCKIILDAKIQRHLDLFVLVCNSVISLPSQSLNDKGIKKE